MSDYLTIIYRITHQGQAKELLERADWSAASHSHAIRARDLMEAQRDELLEALKTLTAYLGKTATHTSDLEAV